MLEVRHLNKAFGGLRVSKDIGMRLEKGEHHAAPARRRCSIFSPAR